MNNIHTSVTTTWVDHIPVLYLDPLPRTSSRRLVICLPGLSGTKESRVKPFMEDLAIAGFVALSFDPWQHGERGTETPEKLSQRVFGNFRRYFWPILGNTALDTLRVIDWAIASLDVKPPVYLLGTSMGGDISVAVAGLDRRIGCVATVVSTPDWLRPGMQGPSGILPKGEADAYAQYFYDKLNPLTHLDSYARGPAISFICGAADNHVPPDGALRFREALKEKYPAAAENIRVTLVPGKGHMDFVGPELWWPESLAWLAGGLK
jgi:uncharacterized protein